ncbi:MAG TPA: IS1634 family transposase, partial [Candidatus Hodarchaeales archaeon]|nr:IS1634 family transposase [Candidatus Hodarchaeales archaeon]
MFIHRNSKRVGNKFYRSILLMENYREGKKVLHRTLLNLSKWKPTDIEALEAVLKGKKLSSLDQVETAEGKSVGALWVFKELAVECGLDKALGTGRNGRLSLLLVLGRLLTQGSRLHLCDWSKNQELEAVLGISRFNEDDLYGALDWLSARQQQIEKKLFDHCYKEELPNLFLYDVTSSYFEGKNNEMAEFGYNRDRKGGKKQIVIGLMTDREGRPLAVEVFKGNTGDPKTFHSQVEKLSQRFGVKQVVMIGDRGMIKSSQIEALKENDFFYITAITKPQIEVLLRNGVLQMGLFDTQVMEIFADPVRYVLRRNPERGRDMAKNRQDKLQKVKTKARELSAYLQAHPGAKQENAVNKVAALTNKLLISEWVQVSAQDRIITISVDEGRLKEVSKLDGCYVIKTNVSKEQLSTEQVHRRYRDLTLVERAFRTIKTGYLEVRPIFLRKETRTRAHVFVTMLAFLLIHQFRKKTADLQITLANMIDSLDKIQTVTLSLPGCIIKRIPEP